MNLKLDELTKEELQKIIEKIAKRLSKEQYEYLQHLITECTEKENTADISPQSLMSQGFVDEKMLQIENSITIQTRSIMGTEIPHVKYTPSVPAPTYAFSTTRESVDLAADAFRKVKDLTVKLSMVENAAYRLATNIKKTQKRANALQNITIPMYTELVYNITNALEEKEREEFTRLKVIKRMKQKKSGG